MEDNKTTNSSGEDVKTQEEDEVQQPEVDKKTEEGEKKPENVIPYERFKEVVQKKNELLEKLAEYEAKISKVDELLNQQKEQYQTELEQYKTKYKEEIYNQFKVIDKEFVDFKVNKLLEENKEIDLKTAVKMVKEQNPQVFEKVPGQGTRGGGSNTSNTITYEEYSKLPKDKRFKLLSKGVKIID